MIQSEELHQIAGAAAGLDVAKLEEPPEVAELTTVHWDARTIGLFRVSGDLRLPHRPGGASWSVVAKVIDHSIKGPEGWVAPDQEVLSYTLGGFYDDKVGLRPAKCFRITRLEPNVTILWLEDLTRAAGPPFNVEQLASMARHLGQWNGLHAKVPRPLPFELPNNAHARRWKQSGLEKFLARFETLDDHPYTRAAYGTLPRCIAGELHEAGSALHAMVTRHDRSLAFGDCNVGNLFHTTTATVAVDWASLTWDPIGVDAGCMIGSAMTFGAKASDIVADEQRLFEEYLAGISDIGLRYDRDRIRAAYLCLLAVYLFYSAVMPALLQVPGEFFTRDFYERRYQTKWEEIPQVVRGVVHSIPAYVNEMRQLSG
jgi:hypothetical protein